MGRGSNGDWLGGDRIDGVSSHEQAIAIRGSAFMRLRFLTQSGRYLLYNLQRIEQKGDRTRLGDLYSKRLGISKK